jgi:hypothetical protein
MICLRLALIGLTVLFVFAASEVRADTYYQWTDKNGVIHMTNNPQNVPQGNKYKVTVREIAPQEAPQPAAPAATQPPAPAAPSAPPGTLPTAPEERGGEMPAPPPSAADIQKQDLEKELADAETVLKYCEQSGYQYVQPYIVEDYMTEEDLSHLRKYGLFQGVVKVRRIDTMYYMRNKVARLKKELEQY